MELPHYLTSSVGLRVLSGFSLYLRICLPLIPTGFNAHSNQRRADLSFCVTPIIITLQVVRNINLFSIDYAFRPRLRSRLTLIRLLTLIPGNLRFRWKGFSPFLSLLMPTFSLLVTPQPPHGTPSTQLNAPLPILRSIASVIYLCPIIIGAKSLDQ